ncbi:MAG: acetoacetate--CoA ligase [Deltaproteobacteria bacterium]|nr:acetoacetate--CoA ligase [Deltaproteobacteria bacterium]
MTAYGDILWTPSAQRLASSHMSRFAAAMSKRSGFHLSEFSALHHWSVTEPGAFWGGVADYCGVKFMTPPRSVFVAPPAGRILGAQWFEGATLNYAEHLLAGDPTTEIIIAYAEGAATRVYTRAALRREVARCAAALKEHGVSAGDRVAGVVANVPEAIVAMLATTSLGGVWSSCSPDFGAAAVTDRLRQIAPKVVFFTERYQYGGKAFDCAAQIQATREALPHLRAAVGIDHLSGSAHARAPGLIAWEEFLYAEDAVLSFVPRAFNDPLFILFSSGTTGVPKAIVHSVGGTLVQHLKELMLHADIGPGSRLMFYTTCGWMMWNWMVSALATGASLVLFEGSVATPDLGVFWRTAKEARVTALGTSPKFVATSMAQSYDVRAVLFDYAPRTVLTTGAPLLPEHFAWLYQMLAPADGDLHVASISGGTDIVSCFMLGTPTLPVRAGEIQYAGLGMDIDAWDDAGRSCRETKAELVCKTPFPSMPIGFWNDEGGKRYHSAYFEHYDHCEVWRHGDFVEITRHGGIVVYGRSDATLNPGGVRIGTAELYRQVETIPGIVDAIAVARRQDGDEAIVLFVKLAPGVALDEQLQREIKRTLRERLTPRHVPHKIMQVGDIPYTRSGKKVELAVTQAIHGEPVTNLAALANPEAMAEFQALALAWPK